MITLILNTLILAFGVGLLTGALGIPLAWITTHYQFTGRKWAQRLLLLPLAFPTYVLAFVHIGMWDYTGTLPTLLREWGIISGGLFPIRSTLGTIIVMSLALYPYMFLLCTRAFESQGLRSLEVAQSLGYGRFSAFFKIALPMARPWIIGAMIMIMMEVVADFGAVSVMNYDTFTTAIYEAWFGFFSLGQALKLSGILVVIVIGFIAVEKRIKANQHFAPIESCCCKMPRMPLHHRAKKWVVIYIASILGLAFIMPIIQLCIWASQSAFSSYPLHMLKGMVLASVTAIILVGFSGVLASYKRQKPMWILKALTSLLTMGYAMPGTVLAVIIYTAIVKIEQFFHVQWVSHTIFIMVVAYGIRFFTVSYQPLYSGFKRLKKELDQCAQSLGLKKKQVLSRVHFPMLKGGVFTSMLLVFVEVMKEMPITLMTRPFGWDTLSVKIYELTSEGLWERAALPALILVAIGFVPVLMVSKALEKNV